MEKRRVKISSLAEVIIQFQRYKVTKPLHRTVNYEKLVID